MFLINRGGAGVTLDETFLSFLRYFVSGMAALGVHLSVLVFLVEGFATEKTLASTAGLVVSLPVNYLLQHFYVFRAKRWIVTGFSKYLVLTFVTASLNALLMWLMTARTPIPYPVAQIMVTGVIFVANFFGNRAFTFGGGGCALKQAEQ
ncbi:MAG TPA: GtrA family protein [Methylocella sp.]|nr:GtrA family protein [Methylocella sp.]